MLRPAVDLEYLEDTKFHIERIVDFLSTNLPLCSIHQTRSLIFFFYLVSATILYVMWPQIHANVQILDTFVMLCPMIMTSMVHIGMTLAYFMFALFSGARMRTLCGIWWYLHTFISVSLAIAGLIYGVDNVNAMVIAMMLGVAADLVCGLVSSSHRVILLFEGIGIIPCCGLIIAHCHASIKLWACLLPFYAFFGFYYFMIMAILGKGRGCVRRMAIKLFNDTEIRAEYVAADDFESFWNSALWGDYQKVKMKTRSSDSESSDDTFSQQDNTILDTKKKDYRFPRKEKFQLYKVDDLPVHPYYIQSLLTVLMLNVFAALVHVSILKGIEAFFWILGVVLVCVVFTIMANSRAFRYDILTITNLSKEQIGILWDHPSLALM